jgi:folate-binding protein YgfZ
MTSPLYELHRGAQAEFQPYGAVEVVSTFGEPQAEYAAVRKSAALMDLPQRGILEIGGRDRLPFLNSILSAETWDKQTKQALPAGRWTYSFLLNLRGRIVADMNVLELGDRTLLELDRPLVEPLMQLLGAYRFAEQVTMTNRSNELHEVALHGPGAAELLPIESTMEQGTCSPHRILEINVIAWRDDVTGSPGIHLIVPIEAARSIWMHYITTFAQPDQLGKRRLRPIGWAAFNATRIEAGRAIFGIDIEPAPLASAMPAKQQREQVESGETSQGMLPAETGQLERAVSLRKCYIGQEIVARMHARGQVARRIVGIRMEDDALPLAGTQILDAESNVVGIITSSTNSPVLSNTAIALGIVKRPLFEVGSALHIPAEGRIRKGAVVQTPFIPADARANSGS